MNLTEILNYIKSKFEEDGRLSAVHIADPYIKWNNTNGIYMSAVVDFQNANMNGDYTDYTFLCYIGTVIKEDESNIYQAFSISDSIMENVLHRIDTEDNDMILVVPAVITPFRQQFTDVLAGVYTSITVRVNIDILCE